MKGRSWKSLACCSKNSSRSQSSSVLDLLPLSAGGGDEGAFVEGAEGGGEELAQAGGGGLLAVERREADDAVFVGEGFQTVRAERRAIGKAAAGLARPAVAEQARDGDVQAVGRSLRDGR